SLLSIPFILVRSPSRPPLFPYTTLFRSRNAWRAAEQDAHAAGRLFEMPGADLNGHAAGDAAHRSEQRQRAARAGHRLVGDGRDTDRKSTRLNSSHVKISYAVFCLKKKKK